MITRSRSFDLGLDKMRMKDRNDVDRQHATVDALLDRFFHDDHSRRWELQLVADEVGMGKTFVALAVAFSILEAMRSGNEEADLKGCFRKVLIITPQNSALFDKWQREIGEFVKRCVKPAHQEDARAWFTPEAIARFDDLPVRLSKPGAGPSVFVANMRIFAGGKLTKYDVKRRFLLAALFRFWGTRFKSDERERLLKGAPDNWPRRPSDLGALSAEDREVVPFEDDHVLEALRQLPREHLDALLEKCREIAAPFTRSRADLFKAVEESLVDTYRMVCRELIRKAFPLVIVDEAHNWKNGPRSGANGYREFVSSIACRARRALLLTATPFQLRPDEMLEILKVGDHLAPSSTERESAERRDRLKHHREKVIAPVLKNSMNASLRFSKEWGALPRRYSTADIDEIWRTPELVSARNELTRYAREPGVVSDEVIERKCRLATIHLDPAIRAFFREALRLHAYNEDLSNELGTIVIRHKRRALHRAFLVGEEYTAGASSVIGRQDRHVLHGAPGLDVKGDPELPHYLLMRCVSEMKGGHGRSSLGSALTGCYTTLLHSTEGKQIQKQLADSPIGQTYVELLGQMTRSEDDVRHPKVATVVEATVRNWSLGEKTLIFCFRVPTARRLQELINDRITSELNRRLQECLGGEDALKALRARFTGRDRDLIVLGLDRVLWSFFWGAHRLTDVPFSEFDLVLDSGDFPELARVALAHGVDLCDERIDRVFLNRAVEHVVARRLSPLADAGPWRRLLDAIADPAWVASPYGLAARNDADDDSTHFDERGVHTVYQRVASPSPAQVQEVSSLIAERHARAVAQNQRSVFDVYFTGPSLWFGQNPATVTEHPRHPTIRSLHRFLSELTVVDGRFDWETRLLAIQSLRRAVLRESILVRLLPARADREEAQWGELLVDEFYKALPGQSESMADRLMIFLEDLVAASGSVTAPGTARYFIMEATRVKEEFVRLVSGETDDTARKRVFAGFNSPLVPEVLVCTSVGQEGIDLHRHCRHVIHYDLAWNPAVLECYRAS
jgi:hypothetical protein